MKFQLSQLKHVLDVRKLTADASFSRISTDTRTLQPGALFVALVGPNFDGHEFIAQAQQKGAVGALVSTEIDTDLPQMVVADTRIGLAILARERRQLMSGKWVASYYRGNRQHGSHAQACRFVVLFSCSAVLDHKHGFKILVGRVR